MTPIPNDHFALFVLGLSLVYSRSSSLPGLVDIARGMPDCVRVVSFLVALNLCRFSVISASFAETGGTEAQQATNRHWGMSDNIELDFRKS